MSIDIHTLAGAYALDAVDDIERAAFDRHLSGCTSCAQEIAELRATVARLTDLNSMTPPASLKQSVLATASRTRQVSPGGRATDRSRSRGWRTWVAGAAAAAVVAVAGGAVGYAISDQNTRTERATVASDSRAAAIMSAPDATVHVRMIGGAKVSVVVSKSLNRGVAIVANMPKVSTAQSYQLWLIHGARPVSAGVMAGGTTAGTVILTDVRGADGFGLSLEKAGGATTPTQPLVTSFGI
jgi:anti-sigma-K factor RskA